MTKLIIVIILNTDVIRFLLELIEQIHVKYSEQRLIHSKPSVHVIYTIEEDKKEDIQFTILKVP